MLCVIGKSSLLHGNQWGMLPHESILRSDQGLLRSSLGSGQVLLLSLSVPQCCGPPNKALILCLLSYKASASAWDCRVLEEGCCGLLVSLFPFYLTEILGARVKAVATK